jgi:hypothetical protein
MFEQAVLTNDVWREINIELDNTRRDTVIFFLLLVIALTRVCGPGPFPTAQIWRSGRFVQIHRREDVGPADPEADHLSDEASRIRRSERGAVLQWRSVPSESELSMPLGRCQMAKTPKRRPNPPFLQVLIAQITILAHLVATDAPQAS